MASSSLIPPTGSTPPLIIGEHPKTPAAGSTTSAKTKVGVPIAPPSVPGEATNPREGFIFPLLDLWYEISSLFPCKSFDFPSPPEDWEWTTIEPEVMVDRACVPCLNEISELLIQKGDIRPVPINFEFPCVVSKDWSHWVDLEILDHEFWDNLQKAGVHWSILISRSCGIFRDTEPLREVLRRWCPAIHTFFFMWRELTLTLEDIANHWMLPILGELSPSGIKLSAREEEIAMALRGYSSTRITGWPALFLHHEDVSVRRAAFIVYWLYFRDNLPLVYRWVGLKTWDHDLVTSLDFEENVLLRPYGEDHPGVEFTPYCPYRVKRQFGFDQDVPTSLQEATPPFSNSAPFIRSRAFAYWEGKVNRIMIPSGHRFGFNTASMNAYWQRLAHAMIGYVNSGRSNKAPISSHCKLQISSLCFSPPSQSAIAYDNSQKLGFAEWDETRNGWIVYTTHFPVGWKESGSKKRAHSLKKTSSKKTKAGKKSRSVAPVPRPEKESATTSSETAVESAAAPLKAKGVATGSSKRKSVAVPPLESVGKQATSSKFGKKSVALRPFKDQRKPTTSSSSPDEEQPSTVLARSPPKKKKSVVPPPPSGAATRTRSKSASIIGRMSSKDFDTVVDDISTRSSDRDDPLAVATDQGEDMGRSFAGSFEADVGSIEESHSVSNADDTLEATELNVESANLTRHDLAIVTHASHSFEYGHDDSDTWLSSYGKFCFHRLGCRLMEDSVSIDLVVVLWKILFPRLGMGDAIHMSEEDAEVGITGKITIASQLSRPIARVGSSVGAGAVPSDSVPYLQQLTTKHGNFVAMFKLGAGFGGPMLSLLGSVLAAMSKSDLGSVTKVQILAWKSVVQDLMEVGFDLGFMIEHLRQIAQHLFGKKISDEVQALQHQIALLQDSLAVLTTY
uniref:Aminotransferase-like plant mobile domain-containing protein n=1 Tax=Fagus sylvatica TaxID=28930 RepID=A0A2N9H782_FAGSY